MVVKGEGGKRGEKQRKRMRGKNQTVSNDLSAQKIDALLAQDKLPNRKMEWQVRDRGYGTCYVKHLYIRIFSSYIC